MGAHLNVNLTSMKLQIMEILRMHITLLAQGT
jgi:hypothetical protein